MTVKLCSWWTLHPGPLLAALSLGVASALGGQRGHYTNEPAGFVPFAENDFHDLPLTNFPSPGGLRGIWYSVGRQGEARRPEAQRLASGGMRIMSEADAPASPPTFLRMKLPQGFRAGRGPVQWGGWAGRSGEDSPEQEKVYASLWIRYVGNDFENQITGMKIFYLQAGNGRNGPGAAETHVMFFLKGNGRQVPLARFPLEVHYAAPTPQGRKVRFVTQNVRRQPALTVGPWHHFEALAELNDLGQENGVVKWWVDGELILESRNLVFRTPSYPHGFWQFKFHPVWGGGKGIKSRDDYIDVDHVYLSGVPLAD